jgi:hypothetical protein
MDRPFERRLGLVGMLAAAGLGLGTRFSSAHDLPVIGPYGGDAAWTMAACAGIRMCLPSLSIRNTAILGYAVSVAVECSQLAHPTWLDEIRAHRLGALLLGRGFLWSDLVAYAAGALIFAAAFGLIERSHTGRRFVGRRTKEAEIAGRNSPPSG